MARQNEENSTVKNNKKPQRKILKRFIIIIGICAAAALFFVVNARARSNASPSVPADDVAELSQGKFIKSINAKGTVKSASSVSVYSTLAYPVQNVLVKVGDKVTAGQPLAKLDDQSILDKIESQKAGINSSEESSAIQIKTANDTYTAAKRAIENGENSAILGAQQQVVTAWENYDKAVKAYERQKSGLDSGLNSSVLSQESAQINASGSLENANITLRDAQLAVDNARADLQKSRDKLSSLETDLKNVRAEASAEPTQSPAPIAQASDAPGEIPGVQAPTSTAGAQAAASEAELKQQIEAVKETITAQERAYDSASSQYDKAVLGVQNSGANLNITQRQGQSVMESALQTLDDYRANIDSAYRSYLAAEDNLRAAQASAQTQLQSYKNSLSSAQAAANNDTANVSLKQMQVELDSTNITAPSSGTVTAVYAEVGKSGSGLLFVIEDLRNLIVESSVKEYDIGTVKKGMPVEITSEATGGLVFPGEVTSIAPTSKKAADGSVSTSGDVEFATDVAVTDTDTGLLVGMSVDLEYIVGSIENTVSVPYDAVYQNDAGKDFILVLDQQGEDKYLIREVPVTVAMENDLDMAITGSGLKAGMRVLNGASEYKDLAGLFVTLSAAEKGDDVTMFGAGPQAGAPAGGRARLSAG